MVKEVPPEGVVQYMNYVNYLHYFYYLAYLYYLYGSVILWDFGLPPFPQLSKQFKNEKNAHFCWKFKFL